MFRKEYIDMYALLTFTEYHTSIHASPHLDRILDHLSWLHTDAYKGTMRQQFGDRYAIAA
jgi:hypothetical protein